VQSDYGAIRNYTYSGSTQKKYPTIHIQDDGKGIATIINCEHKKGEDPDKTQVFIF
jgi:hypothetical protein